MATKRDKHFLWVTWLTALISGERQCEFQPWFKVRNKLDKKPGNFQLAKWNVKHNQLVHKTRNSLEKDGYQIKTEEQNSFKMVFPNVTLSGKPDIVAVKPAKALVVDCKTGQPKTSDQLQVVLYMLYLSKCVKEYEGVKFDGRVEYGDGNTVDIYWRDVDSGMKDIIQNYIDRLSADKPCRKVASFGECRYCDLSKQDCPERMG